jgi:trehalose 6-phosphate phosphatase
VETLDLLASEPERSALFLDVDGVLAPVVPHRDDARVPEPTREELRRLRTAYGLVACVTGRPTADARRIVGVEELVYAGEHGLELEPAAADWADRLHAFARSTGWHDLEEKTYSATFHYRQADDRDAAEARLAEIAAEARALGLRARFGRMILEVLPPVDATKGTAVRHLLEGSGLRRALYAGDDTTDLDGFAALDGLEVAVRVAVADGEGPSELRDRADLVVGSPGELLDVLRRL